MDPQSPLPPGGKGSAPPASNQEGEVNNTNSRPSRGLEDPPSPRTPGPSNTGLPEYKDQCRPHGGKPNNEESNTSTIPFANSVHLIETSDVLLVAALPNDSVASDGQPQHRAAHNAPVPTAPAPPVIPDGIDNNHGQHDPLFPPLAPNNGVQQPAAAVPGTSTKHLICTGALVILVVILAAVLITALVGQNKTGNVPTSATSNSNSKPSTSAQVTMPPFSTPSTSPLATMPSSSPSWVTLPPSITPAPTMTTQAPLPSLIGDPNQDKFTQGPAIATIGPSVCNSPDCFVENELIPVLPNSTRAKLNEIGSCQNSTLAWIADSDLGLERILQRYALAVLACEMKLPSDLKEFGESECEWLGTISGLYPCNDNGNVESLRLSNKQITGTLPPEISILSNIMVIDFSSNEINGTIPSELGNLSLLQELVLNNNNLTGSMPSEVCALRKLELLETLVVDCPSIDQSLQQAGVNCSCCNNSCTLE